MIAILEALIWGGALRKQVIFIHFDCIPIGNFVFGLCFSVQEDLRPLATLTRALVFFLRERGAKIVGRHIYGHDEHPWNEFADVVAKHASRKHVRFGFGASLVSPWNIDNVEELQWAWLFHRQSHAFDDAFPPIEGDSMYVRKTAPYQGPILSLPGINETVCSAASV